MLKGKQPAFVQEYLIDLNATQAAIRAGYSKKTAKDIGCENLAKPNIQEAIQKALKKRELRTEITQDRVLKEYARIAFLDPRNFFDESDNLKSITELDDDTAACLTGMDISTRFIKNKGDDLEPETVKKIKFIDKKGALDSVAKHLGMFEKDNKQKNPDIFHHNIANLTETEMIKVYQDAVKS